MTTSDATGAAPAGAPPAAAQGTGEARLTFSTKAELPSAAPFAWPLSSSAAPPPTSSPSGFALLGDAKVTFATTLERQTPFVFGATSSSAAAEVATAAQEPKLAPPPALPFTIFSSLPASSAADGDRPGTPPAAPHADASAGRAPSPETPPSRAEAPAEGAASDTNANAQLKHAAVSGNPDAVASALAAGADAAAESEPPLATLAARAGASAALRLLLAAGAPPAPCALRAAANAISPACVEQLLAAGAAVNAADSRGCTALMTLAQSCVVAFAGAAQTTAHTDGTGRVRSSAAAGAVADACAALLRAGADVHAADAGGRTPLSLAQCFAGGPLDGPLLAQLQAVVDAADAAREARVKATAALREAAIRGDADAAAAALAAGADAAAAAGADGTLALAAARHGTPTAAEGGDESATPRDADAFAALLRALGLAGAELDARDARGATALHLAAARGCMALATALLQCGADANAEVTKKAAAPAPEAATAPDSEAPAADADAPLPPNAETPAPAPAPAPAPVPDTGSTQQQQAAGAEQERAPAPQFSAGVEQRTLVRRAIRPAAKTTASAALASSAAASLKVSFEMAEPPAVDVLPASIAPVAPAAVEEIDDGLRDVLINGATPLLIAAHANNAALVKLLLSTGARVDHAPYDVTPLFEAASVGAAECVAALLAAQADLQVCYPHAVLKAFPGFRGSEAAAGFTALHAAALVADASVGGACMAALLAAGADPNAASEAGDTPLHLVARVGAEDATRALLAAGADALAPTLRRLQNVPVPAETGEAGEPKLADSSRLVTAPTHPGSWVGCGGNPAGTARCAGGGNCGVGCADCGARTHWSCCASTDAFSLCCRGDMVLKQAAANVTACMARAPVPRKVVDIPGVRYLGAEPSAASGDASASAATGEATDDEAAAAAVLALSPGAGVYLAAHAAATFGADVADGPLLPGVMATIAEPAPDAVVQTQQVVVRTPDGDTWAYPAAALAPALASQPSSGAAEVSGSPTLREGVTYAHGAWRFARVTRPGACTDELLAWRIGGGASEVYIDFAVRLDLTSAPLPCAFWDGAHEWMLPANVTAWGMKDGAARALRAGARPLYGDVAALARAAAAATAPLPALQLPFALRCVHLSAAPAGAAALGAAPSICVGLGSSAVTLRLEQHTGSSAAASAAAPPPGALSLLSKTRTLPFVPRASGADPLPLILGDAVRLTSDIAQHNTNTAGGPLQYDGPAGEVIELNGSASGQNGRLQVRAANKKTWWYAPAELELVEPCDYEESQRLGDCVEVWFDEETRVGVIVAAHTRPPPPMATPPDAPAYVEAAVGLTQVRVRLPDGTLMWEHADETCVYSADSKEATRELNYNLYEEDDFICADTPAHLAAAGGHVGALRLILQAGGKRAACAYGADDGHEPLHAAARVDAAACVEALLEAGAPMSSHDGSTPLHIAAAAGATAALVVLLASPQSADIIASCDPNGRTARDVARSNAERRLLNAAAAAARARATELARAAEALFVAAAADDAAALRSAADAAGEKPLGKLRDGGRTLLHAACAAGAASAVQLLLADASVDVSAPDDAGALPLHVLASSAPASAAPLVAALLARGAAVDATDKDGATPLLLAAGRADGEALVLPLLDAGAEVSARSVKSKRTALHAAAGAGCEAVVAALLARGAEPEAADADGATPLHAAAACAVPDAASACVAALLAAPASPLSRDSAGRAPADVAATSGARDALRAAATAAARTDPSARWAAEKGRPGFHACPALDELMALTGLHAVKSQALSLYHAVRVVAERRRVNGDDASKSLLSEMVRTRMDIAARLRLC